MKIYFTSDLHLGHENIIDLSNRMFFSIERMDDTIIKNWNSIVRDEDVVYILGDFCFKRFSHYWKQLKGNKVLIKGNHDKKGLDEATLYLFDKEWQLIHRPQDSGYKYVLHGHVHKPPKIHTQKNDRLFINVCCELWDYKPVSMKQIYNLMERKENERRRKSCFNKDSN